MGPDAADKVILEYAAPPRRRPLGTVIDLELWAVVGVVVALLVADAGCIVLILLRG
jgi:hypothetical protein